MRGALLALLLLAACATPPGPGTPRTVERVDLARYLGTWHEVARLPQSFQDSRHLVCTATTAEYAAAGPGRITVTNACANALDPAAPRRVARGEAYVVEGSEGARLRVSFFWPFYGDYWVLGLDPDYRWAVVGSPSRRSLWVLSRTPQLPEAELEQALAIARREGFDLGPLIRQGS
ncbi:MAG: lipocalin family protein [Rubritepida sp.]|nr:lipocalin family protein [Rubritepida sp.]